MYLSTFNVSISVNADLPSCCTIELRVSVCVSQFMCISKQAKKNLSRYIGVRRFAEHPEDDDATVD